MKKKFWLFPLLACILMLTGCGKSLSNQSVLDNVKQSNTITWGVKGDVRLFGLIDVRDGQQKGFDVDMAKAITKHILGPKGRAEFVTTTSQSRIPLLKNGNIDAVIATMSITPERKKVISFSKSYFDAGQSLLVPKSSKIRSTKDLNGKTVIGVVGSNSVDNIKKAAPKAKVIELQDYAQAMNALKSGQGDALTTDNGILFGLAVQNPGYEVRGGTFTIEPYGVAVDKGQTGFTKAVDKAVLEMQHSGEYNRLIKKWFGDVPGFNYKELYRR
ncbi:MULTISPECIES: transporter substrate-binding domain-containing protein [Lactobacillus]|uniref:transporter substrate-binding domain-containing protein n=1 Tax=Lactobacillus TaxID=1578 RepID=UPI001C6A564A|nr:MULTISPECIES: transporter substrate-binding domain-containing protein [Lactobacillus]MCX8720202.1 transporter substrate-binding domain-containing protein [Lactobacillus sp. B4010]MCX8733403.1 transporter substrate-binding domain-containing protein [Lactobacillus sp. B4015]MCX8735524.1 transporter substrate-binding domain-containing protein [Lactobacillus sp. B4012]QYN56176.1 transporter substrate-binding domain-containing protein [Lactobacillus panisapium]